MVDVPGEPKLGRFRHTCILSTRMMNGKIAFQTPSRDVEPSCLQAQGHLAKRLNGPVLLQASLLKATQGAMHSGDYEEVVQRDREVAQQVEDPGGPR